MIKLTEENLTEIVLNSFSKCDDPRLREVMSSFVTHLHSFIRDVEPTQEEWLEGIKFLTATGQTCDDQRQEYILLSDITGASMLMDAINNRKPAGATETSVMGPFYEEGAPEMQSGVDLAPGEQPGVVVSGTVKNLTGEPIPDAMLDIWQTDPNGLYHMQDEHQEHFHLCAKIKVENDGRYKFRTVKPVSYSVPTDGPVGLILKNLNRHSYRPAHMHFLLSAPGYKPVVTQIYTRGDQYLDSDTVFGVKESLVGDYVKAGEEYTLEYDWVLEPVQT